MAGKDTVAVFNNTQRIIALKGQVPNKDKKNRSGEPKRFCTRLAPGILCFVPKAFWAIYKRNPVTQSLLDTEQLMVNKKPANADAPKKIPKKSAEESALAALANSGEEGDDGDEGTEE